MRTKTYRNIFLMALLLSISFLAASCACGGCGEAAAQAELAQMFPAKADVSIIVTRWKDLQKGLEIGEEKFGENFPVNEAFKDFEKESGMDLGDPDSLKEHGLDPTGSLGGLYIDENVVLMLPVKDADTLNDFLKKDAEKSDTIDDKVHEEKVGDSTMYILVDEGAKKPKKSNIQAAWLVKNDMVMIFFGDEEVNKGDGRAVLKDLAKLKSSKSLAKSDHYKDIKKKLGDDNLIYAYFNTKNLLRMAAEAEPSDAASFNMAADRLSWAGMGMKINDKGLDVRLYSTGDEEIFTAMAKAMTAKSDFEGVAASIDGKPAFVVKLALDVEKLLQEIGKADPNMKGAIEGFFKDANRNLGVDVRKDLLPTLDGNIALVTYDGDARAIMSADIPGLLEEGKATIALGVKDQKKLVKVAGDALKKMGAKPKEDGNVTVFQVGPGKNPFMLVIGQSAAVLSTKAAGEDKLKKMAQGKGSGLKGVYTKGVAKKLLSGKDGSGVAVDVTKILKMLGDAADKSPEAQTLKGMKSWSFNSYPDDEGGVIDIEVDFK
mgnify:CR=1 FL=1